MAIDLGNYRLAAVEHREDQPLRVRHRVEEACRLVHHFLDVGEVAARAERLALAGDDHDARIGVMRDLGEEPAEFDFSAFAAPEIGGASGRERGCKYV